MKKIIYISFVFITVLFASCEYDNYDAPSLEFKGKLTYNGENFLFDGNRGLLKVYQSGFGKQDNGTEIRIDNNGEFKQLLYAGNYRLTPDNRRYPFEFKDFKPQAVGYDSMHIDLKKNIEINFAVIPYYTLNNFTTTLEGENMVMRFRVSKVSGTDRPAPKIIRARCYVGTSVIVNSWNQCTTAINVEISEQGEIEIAIPVSEYRSKYVNNFRTYAFCRAAIELENIPDYYLFTEIKKLEGIPE